MRNGSWNKEAEVTEHVRLYELDRRRSPPMYIVLLILKRSCEAAYHGRPLTTIMKLTIKIRRRNSHLHCKFVLVQSKVGIQDRQLVVFGAYEVAEN